MSAKGQGSDAVGEQAVDFLPSRDLQHLAVRRTPSLSKVEAALKNTARALGVSEKGKDDEREILFDGNLQDPDEDEDDRSGEEFEMRVVRNWLTGIVASDLDWLAKDGDGDEQKVEERREEAVSRAAELLAVCAGKSASGPSRVRYNFATPSGTLSVRSQEATLTEDALGGRTWGAAPLLLQHLLKDPDTRQSLSLDSPCRAGRPLRILEIGAGTGLVGLGLALARRKRPSNEMNKAEDKIDLQLVLTDHHPNVLANLTSNVALNGIETGSSTQVRRLDWQAVYDAQAGEHTSSTYSSKAQTLPVQSESSMDPTWLEPLPFEDGTVDILIAADCVYDPLHPTWIRAVAEKYLRRPSSSTTNSQHPTREEEGGLMHMISPLRSTHAAEMTAIYHAFPSSKSSQGTDGPQREEEGKDEVKLLMAVEAELKGYDDFGPPRLRLGTHAQGARRMDGTQTMYRRFEIRWRT
ncbi:unnamed protein product [Tilletia controversa]|uniref:Uncharacterized protein n=3 Tax=Tilletia TaxID=13289 RepID=A0A8X7SY17_9BASI|nr:hypothetical protein CF336_g2880 [Tilletia laevis]KAE8203692.1 hypothetical protein CF328_g1510 [Tilletia controversa]KAE8264209.1 hypothetical protein A4X03_0g1104 [Tilletia caries]KAE8206186.1 hypothetical protein CF335_g2047 [Tilletia laevis]KAE8249155.1 hypothetical protein A4X06_0g3357 [Tilletia controversa]